MAREESKETVWNSLTQALKSDRSRTNILKISEFGLVEMTRKRVRESLSQTLCDPCGYCEGKGYIKSSTTTCYEIVRAIQRTAANNPLKKIITVETHNSVYDLLIEEESDYLEKMETKYNIEIIITANPKIHQEKYNISIT